LLEKQHFLINIEQIFIKVFAFYALNSAFKLALDDGMVVNHHNLDEQATDNKNLK
jgi:hypothetical protein